MSSPCPACTGTRAPGQYLCRDCWFQLPTATRTQLNRRDTSATGRLRQLLDQIHAGTPLPDIRIE